MDVDWISYEHPEGLFKISHPARWPRVSPVSNGAAISCRPSDNSALLEVLCMRTAAGGLVGSRLVEVIADGVEKTPYDDNLTDGRVLDRKDIAAGKNGKCVRVTVSFKERSVSFTSIYYIAGAGHDALYVAIKQPTVCLKANLPLFEAAISTLETPWLTLAR